MNPITKCYCRLYQLAFRLAMPLMPYREPERFDSIHALPSLFSRLKIRSVLLVTDEHLRQAGITAPLEALLKESGIRCTVYDRTRANPTVHNVEEARAQYLQENCQALIAMGGGSSMDCAKAVGARIVCPRRSLNQMKGLLRVLRSLPPLVAIPTTAGTGSEVTVTAVITDTEKKHKYTMNNFTMIPRYTVLDPAVTRTLPSFLTATTGMDALTHAVEAYIGGSTTARTRRLARKAVRLIFENLETACLHGEDLKARKNMLRAAHIAGIAFTRSYVGYIHAVAHSLGGQYNTPHGLANAVLLPIGLEHYGPCVHRKLWELARSARIAGAYTGREEGAAAFIAAIRRLNERLGIPGNLPQIRLEDIPVMAAHAAREANPLYPVPRLMDAKELRELYRKAADRR
ncbi:MAG: iron-containing alcohol dehydrogenase [Lachnospiraceae bacterium]|jgi:alcohol dehydrogenase|nr:iron-containing alcohol dehydrogenase [Lachnospiraceae bacterium]